MSAGSPKDDNFVGIDLYKDWVEPRCEFWDLDQNPGLCLEPEHLYGGQIVISSTHPAGNVDLVVSKSQG